MALERGNVRAPNRAAIGFEKIHPARAARHEDRLETERSHQRFRSPLDVGVARGSAMARRCLGELLLVRRQQIGAAVLAKITALRIDRHERLSPSLDDGAKHLPGENALVVIRAHDSRRGLSRLLHGADHEPLISRRQRSACLAIDAEHVLAASHHARLQRRRPVAGPDHALRVDSRAFERPQQPASGLVISDNADEPHTASERSEVERGVRRAARSVCFALPTEHLDRRFRRNALDIAPHVVVAHDVADDQNRRRRNGELSHWASRLSPTCRLRPTIGRGRDCPACPA